MGGPWSISVSDWMDDASGTTLCFPSGSRTRPQHAAGRELKAETSGQLLTTQVEAFLSYPAGRLSIRA